VNSVTVLVLLAGVVTSLSACGESGEDGENVKSQASSNQSASSANSVPTAFSSDETWRCPYTDASMTSAMGQPMHLSDDDGISCVFWNDNAFDPGSQEWTDNLIKVFVLRDRGYDSTYIRDQLESAGGEFRPLITNRPEVGPDAFSSAIKDFSNGGSVSLQFNAPDGESTWQINVSVGKNTGPFDRNDLDAMADKVFAATE